MDYIVNKHNTDKEKYDNLIKSGLKSILSKIYANRKVGDIESTMFNPKKSIIPSTKLLNCLNMVYILSDIIQTKKRILIVADYDCDGATACTIGMKGLLALGANIDYMVPNRFKHGYGLTDTIIEEVMTTHKIKPDYILTVDNGIASHVGILKAKEYGIEVLVTDHHLAADTLPEALCIVNPNQHDCTFPSKNLAGCGVIYYIVKTLESYMTQKNLLPENYKKPILEDILALGTIADVVKLDLNNRNLVRMGMEIIKNNKANPGIKALFEISNRNIYRATTMDLGFSIGPRLNAAGRMDDMSVGIKCLLANTYSEALEYAKKLHDLNEERKNKQEEMVDIANNFINHNNLTQVVYDPDFHEGIIGIVAGKIKEQKYAPTIVFSNVEDNDELLKGSGRSIDGFHLRDGIDIIYKRKPHIIAKFGGHSMAAGLTIYKKYLNEFIEEFEAVAKEVLTEDLLQKNLFVDADINEHPLDLNIVKQLNNEIWGSGFETPLFQGQFDIIEQTILKDAHLKIKIKYQNEIIDAMLFGCNQKINDKKVDMVFSANVNFFRNEENLQFLIKQINSI